MREHITILGALYIAFGFMGILGASIILIAVAGGGLLSGDPEAIFYTSTVGVTVSSLLFVLSAPSVVGGIGLLRHRTWARYLVLVLGCFHLPGLPFGTALGVYTIWVLINPEAVALFVSPPEKPLG